jgi:hypothetical protein
MMLFELLGLTNYVRYLDIVLVPFELLDLKNYVRYLDIDLMLFEQLEQHPLYVYVMYVVCKS